MYTDNTYNTKYSAINLNFFKPCWEMKLALRNLDFERLGVELQNNYYKSVANKFWSELNQEIHKIFDGSRNWDFTISP